VGVTHEVWVDPELENYRSRASNMDACNLFVEMSTWEVREPSHILEVIVCRAYYPITEEIFSQIFGPSTRVFEVLHVEARVLFPSKLEAAEAFGEFHGWHIYDGCCQMIIRWGIFQECSTTADMTFANTMRSSSCKPLQVFLLARQSTLNPASTVVMPMEIDVEPSKFNSDAPFKCSMNCLSHMVDVTTSVSLDDRLAFDEESDKGLVFDEEPSDTSTNMPSNCSMECTSLFVNITTFAVVFAIANEVLKAFDHTSVPSTTSETSTTCIDVVISDKPGLSLSTTPKSSMTMSMIQKTYLMMLQ
jgi:hypothetical protein